MGPAVSPPDPKPAEQVKPKRDRTPRTPRRRAVTVTEAMTAAQHAIPGLRACTDVPRVVTADLEIVRSSPPQKLPETPASRLVPRRLAEFRLRTA